MSRQGSLRSFLKTPKFENPETTRQVEAIQTVLLPLFGGVGIFVVVSIFSLQDGVQSALIAAGAGLALAVCLLLARIGLSQQSGALIVSLLWLIATTDLLLGGGVSAPGQNVYLVAILMAAFIMSIRAALVMTAMSLIATGFVAWLEMSGQLPASLIAREPLTYWWAQAVTFLSVSGLIWIALHRTRRAIGAAQRNQRLHRLVADSADDFIWSLDASNTFTYASPAVERILGFTPKEMLGTQAAQEQLVPGSPEISELIREAIAEGQDVLRYEAQQLRKDGTAVWCEFSLRLLFDDEGTLAGLTGVTRDISERKRVEVRQQDLEQQFRQSQKMEAIGQLAGGIAHDFNNYLTVILGNAELLALETEVEKGSPLLEIEDAAARSAELTRQLLAFSRKQVLQPVILDLNRVIRDADRLLRRVLGEDISIETICAGGLGHVEVDPNQLEQVILNLAVNARAAMPDGGKLTIETGNVFLDSEYAERRVDVSPGRYVMLAVSDGGVGMDEETRQRIFEPFFTTKGSGTGLGLSTVHGIVTQSGGTIGVYSEPGEGTTFRIYLPRVDAAAGVLAENVDVGLAEEERGSETVLVVEDQEMVRRMVQRMLEARGYQVVLAGDRDEAIAAGEAVQGRIDLLLTDIILPGTNGVKLAKEFADRFDAKVLYMSGFTENGIVHRGILDPDRLLLQKPFTAKQLARKVREALES